jgi:hypothetical protein
LRDGNGSCYLAVQKTLNNNLKFQTKSNGLLMEELGEQTMDAVLNIFETLNN